MTVPVIGTVDFGGPEDAAVLIVGPSLGTSVSALWSPAAPLLTRHVRMIGFDLPGHGQSPRPSAPFTIADLAAAVHGAAAALAADGYHYAGVSAAGAVGLELLLNHPDSIRTAALICTGAKIRTADDWFERARVARSDGTATFVGAARATWFTAGFPERASDTAAALLKSLVDTDSEGYAATCEALAAFDVRPQLRTITGNVLAIAGDHDLATPPQSVRHLAAHIPRCHYRELPQTAHLAPAEQPDLIAHELRANTLRSPR